MAGADHPPAVRMAATILARRLKDGERIDDLTNCVAVVALYITGELDSESRSVIANAET